MLTPCLNGTGKDHGYSRQRFAGVKVALHKLTATLSYGDVPRGYEVHHLCENKACYRPDHLALLTRSEHKRVHLGAVTHCVNGHPRKPRTDGCRTCYECEKDNKKRAYWARKEDS